ncbi:MAG: hypothetical protein ABI401_04870 [Candidatus Dormibacter sp.]
MVQARAAVSTEQVHAYEKVLSRLLGYQSSDALRTDFRRVIVREAVDQFPAALDKVRSKGQPEERALPWAIEAAMIERLRREVPDIADVFKPEGASLPSPEVEAKVRAAWEEEAPR